MIPLNLVVDIEQTNGPPVDISRKIEPGYTARFPRWQME